MNIIKLITQQISQTLTSLYPEHTASLPLDAIEVTAATNKSFGHYQCNSAMKLNKLIGLPPRTIAESIREQIISNPKFMQQYSSIAVAGPGFINITLSTNFIADLVNQQLQDPKNIIIKTEQPLKTVIDFSSPNIAKEMHVGHLRSTIIGDCLARILEYLGHNVLRLNHVGDWGTQFGMLIAYLKQQPKFKPENFSTPTGCNFELSELAKLYKLSKQKFDADPEFKFKAQQEVISLQQGDKLSRNIWQQICVASASAYNEIYDLLDIKITDRGESFYQPLLAPLIADLEQKNLLQVSDGAKCVYLDGFTNKDGDPLPLIVQKSDGGFNYAATDLAAVQQRITQEHAKWLIYVTDAGQSQHFQMVFATCQLAGIYQSNKVKIQHVPFGLVLRPDGKKFKTRSGDTEKLIDLINTAITKAKAILQKKKPELTIEQLEHTAKIIGINSIKYADLANNRISNYTFNYDTMLQFEGNTAAFLNYAYVRIQSIKRKVNLDLQQLLQAKSSNQIILQEPSEIELGLQICQFNEALDKTVQDLMPNRLTDYLHRLAEKFHNFFHHCRVEGTEQQTSRILLCQATANVLAIGFSLLGLKSLDSM